VFIFRQAMLRVNLFFAVGFGSFAVGFLKKEGAERGFFVVSLWWNCGSLTVAFSGWKICHFLEIYFWGFPFWEWVGTRDLLQVGLGPADQSRKPNKVTRAWRECPRKLTHQQADGDPD